MTQRIDYMAAAPDAVKAIYGLETYVATRAGLDKRLLHLLKLRASLINGCAYCVDMHTKEARKDGLSEQWIALVSVWHEAAIYTARERAVLAWTDALTNIAQTGAPGRGLGHDARPLFRCRDYKSDRGHQHNQCVEPACRRISDAT